MTDATRIPGYVTGLLLLAFVVGVAVGASIENQTTDDDAAKLCRAAGHHGGYWNKARGVVCLTETPK